MANRVSVGKIQSGAKIGAYRGASGAVRAHREWEQSPD